jgi:hypothetical protein
MRFGARFLLILSATTRVRTRHTMRVRAARRRGGAAWSARARALARALARPVCVSLALGVCVCVRVCVCLSLSLSLSFSLSRAWPVRSCLRNGGVPSSRDPPVTTAIPATVPQRASATSCASVLSTPPTPEQGHPRWVTLVVFSTPPTHSRRRRPRAPPPPPRPRRPRRTAAAAVVSARAAAAARRRCARWSVRAGACLRARGCARAPLRSLLGAGSPSLGHRTRWVTTARA